MLEGSALLGCSTSIAYFFNEGNDTFRSLFFQERSTRAETLLCSDCLAKNRDTMALSPAAAAGQAALSRAKHASRLPPVSPAAFMGAGKDAWKKPSLPSVPKLLRRHASARETAASPRGTSHVQEGDAGAGTKSPSARLKLHRRDAAPAQPEEEEEVNLLSDDEGSAAGPAGSPPLALAKRSSARQAEHAEADLGALKALMVRLRSRIMCM